MPLPNALSIALSALAIVLAIVAIYRASEKIQTRKIYGKLRNLELECAELADAFERVLKNQKRATARANMAKHREKKNGAMSDEEWRRWATKRVQQGLPIEE